MNLTKQRLNYLLLGSLLFLVGCQSSPSRPVAIAGGSALGGGIGYAVSDGNPWATIGGAAGGGALTHFVMGDDPQTLQKGFDAGYVRGNSDAIKRQYAMLQSLNQPSGQGGKLSYYSVPVQGPTPDGRNLVSHTVTVPIVE